MRTIYKYPVDRGLTRLDLPRGSRVVAVDIQHGELMAWVLHEREALSRNERTEVDVTIARTGGDVPFECGDYVSTFYEHGGLFVWHAFVRYQGHD